MAGVRTYINFPHLLELRNNNNIAIQQANLIVNVAGLSDTSSYPAPFHISLVGINDEGNNIILTDYLEGTTYFGGSYLPNTNQYVFNITHTIQEILLGTSKISGLRLIVSGDAVLANRAIIQGTDVGADRMRLKIYYTDVKL